VSMKEPNSEKGILVVGGGVAGIQASLDLAEMGRRVYLVESSPAIGGNMAKLDKTFPTNDCAMCMISPKLVECARRPNIEIFTLSEVTDVVGTAGDFRVTLRMKPRFIDMERCVGCGLCAQKCPKKVIDAYNEGLATRKAVSIEYPQAIPLVYAIDPDECIYLTKGKCRICEKVCAQKAVDFLQKPEERILRAAAVVLAPGYTLYDAGKVGEYGYGRYRNVVTSLEFERMLSASGPGQGHVTRPSDGKEPRKIAWIQCVGSRDVSRDRGFCSSVCCMYAVKQARVMKEHDPGIQPALFYMDLRAQGRGFDTFCLKTLEETDLRMIRSMVSQVSVDPSNENLLLEYLDLPSRSIVEEEFDLVVLSVGMDIRPEAARLMDLLGIERNVFGFAAYPFENAVGAGREGVFVCGAIQGPKDIPETVAQAGAAAAGAARFLERSEPPAAPAPLPWNGEIHYEAPRIGVFVCHCGINIAGVVDVHRVAEDAGSLPHVAHSEDLLFSCSTDSQKHIREVIQEKNLNRVVVASCSPRTHEKLFRETIQEAGLNPYVYEQANIRDQCSWVHQGDKEAATEKAMDLVRRSVARAALLEPLEEISSQVRNRALVIGGGPAGMSAALTFAEQDIDTVLLEQSDRLGGFALNLPATLEGNSPRALARSLAERVERHPLIQVYTQSVLSGVEGAVGNFKGAVQENGRRHEVEFGAAVVATGGSQYTPREYFYGTDERVLTQVELSGRLDENPDFGRSVQTAAMIQCIGSRNDENPLCSRVCCSAAVRGALALKERNPDALVVILYRDIRTFGFREQYYTRAREQGILFARFEPESPPVLQQVGASLELTFRDPTSGLEIRIEPDLVVLSAGIRPASSSADLSRTLRLPRTQEGYFLEAHVKLRPLDFSTPGFFLAGLAHSPQFVEEAVTQGLGAAARALGVLTKARLVASSTVAHVDADRCSVCLTCVRACPYGVPRIEPGAETAAIDPAACQGCGVCASECPGKAITLRHFSDEQVLSQIQGDAA